MHMFFFLINSVERLNDKLDVSHKKVISSSELICLSCDVLLLQKINQRIYWFHTVVRKELFWRSLASPQLLGVAEETEGAWYPTDVMQCFGKLDPKFSQLCDIISQLGSLVLK